MIWGDWVGDMGSLGNWEFCKRKQGWILLAVGRFGGKWGGMGKT